MENNLNGWKDSYWQEKTFKKSMRFWIRDEIEEIIKEENIDRKKFHEFSKLRYQDIINKFYYSFCDHKIFLLTG